MKQCLFSSTSMGSVGLLEAQIFNRKVEIRVVVDRWSRLVSTDNAELHLVIELQLLIPDKTPDSECAVHSCYYPVFLYCSIPVSLTEEYVSI